MEKLDIGHSSEREKKMKEKINEIIEYINNGEQVTEVKTDEDANIELNEQSKQDLLNKYEEKFGKKVPGFKQNDTDWILKKLNE